METEQSGLNTQGREKKGYNLDKFSTSASKSPKIVPVNLHFNLACSQKGESLVTVHSVQITSHHTAYKSL